MHFRLLYVLLFITGALKAQLREFTIAEMPRPEVAVVQANTQFSDDALLLVYSDIEGLEFRSSLDKLDKQTYNAAASRYEILVKPNKQLIFVAKSGYIEVKLTTLNPSPKDVFYFKVGDIIVDDYPALEATLQINSYPSGADIYLNDMKLANKTPYLIRVNEGKTRIKLKRSKFYDLDTVITVKAEIDNIWNATLKPNCLVVNVNSTPIGAEVYFENERWGTTPLSRLISFDGSSAAQRGILTLVKTDYEVFNEEISFSPSAQAQNLNLTLKHKLGSYTVTSNPTGAEVFIDDVFQGYTPLQGQLPVGSHMVRVSLDDYETVWNKGLLVEPLRPAEVEFTLNPIAHSILGDTGFVENKQHNRAFYTGNNRVLYTGDKSGSGSGGGSEDGKGPGKGSGTGPRVSFSLLNRSPLSLPKPSYNSEKSGKVVVDITVDESGKVIKAIAGGRGTTVQDKSLFEQAEAAALKTKFNPSSTGEKKQRGTITYNFIRP